jgi:ADP-heptose:LPS heptosyltransferase
MNYLWLGSTYKRESNIDQKILIIAASHTGNNIFCTPAIRFLKKHFPNVNLDIVSLNSMASEVFYENPDINEVFITKNSYVINKLARNYTKVICLHKEALKKLRKLNDEFLVAPDYKDGEHRAEQMLQYVANLTKKPITEEDRAYVIAQGNALNCFILNQFKIDAEDILVCMHLGCGRIKTHGWNFLRKSARTHKKLLPIQEYIELANALIAINPNVRIVITGTKNERFLGDAFVKNVPRTINLIAKTSIPQLFHMMSEFKLFVSQDCGILHVAAASSVSILGLFGPTNPNNTGPYPIKKNHVIIKETNMKHIKPTVMLEAAINLLGLSTTQNRLA